MSTGQSKNLTVVLPAGRLPLSIMAGVQEIASGYGLNVHLSAAQNLRITNIAEADFDQVKAKLMAKGIPLFQNGSFPVPTTCLGVPHCRYGIVNTEELSRKLLDYFQGMTSVKPKLKIAIAGCGRCCANVKLADLGILAAKCGFELYVGGKGGGAPMVGVRIGKELSEEKLFAMIAQLVEYHSARAGTRKRRMFQLLKEDDFPFTRV